MYSYSWGLWIALSQITLIISIFCITFISNPLLYLWEDCKVRYRYSWNYRFFSWSLFRDSRKTIKDIEPISSLYEELRNSLQQKSLIEFRSMRTVSLNLIFFVLLHIYADFLLLQPANHKFIKFYQLQYLWFHPLWLLANYSNHFHQLNPIFVNYSPSIYQIYLHKTWKSNWINWYLWP